MSVTDGQTDGQTRTADFHGFEEGTLGLINWIILHSILWFWV